MINGRESKETDIRFEYDASNTTVKVLRKEKFEELKNNTLNGISKLEDVTLYNYGIFTENAINCKIKLNIKDGEGSNHEISFVKAFSVTDQTIKVNEPTAEEKGRESIVNLEFNGNYPDELIVSKITYK